jgi:hypothetical protein
MSKIQTDDDFRSNQLLQALEDDSLSSSLTWRMSTSSLATSSARLADN